MLDKLIITDLQFHGYCGMTDAEREAGQRLSVDLEMYCDVRRSASAERLEGVPDYSRVAGFVLEVGRKARYRLLESLADHLANALLNEFASSEIVLRVKKISPPVEAIGGYFGVEVRRRREAT